MPAGIARRPQATHHRSTTTSIPSSTYLSAFFSLPPTIAEKNGSSIESLGCNNRAASRARAGALGARGALTRNAHRCFLHCRVPAGTRSRRPQALFTATKARRHLVSVPAGTRNKRPQALAVATRARRHLVAVPAGTRNKRLQAFAVATRARRQLVAVPAGTSSKRPQALAVATSTRRRIVVVSTGRSSKRMQALLLPPSTSNERPRARSVSLHVSAHSTCSVDSHTCSARDANIRYESF